MSAMVPLPRALCDINSDAIPPMRARTTAAVAGARALVGAAGVRVAAGAGTEWRCAAATAGSPLVDSNARTGTAVGSTMGILAINAAAPEAERSVAGSKCRRWRRELAGAGGDAASGRDVSRGGDADANSGGNVKLRLNGTVESGVLVRMCVVAWSGNGAGVEFGTERDDTPLPPVYGAGKPERAIRGNGRS